MIALWSVVLFPVLQMIVYGLLFTTARIAGGVSGMARMSRLAPHLFPLILALPLGAILGSGFDWVTLWATRPTELWVVLGTLCGATLFYGEAALNVWCKRRSNGGSVSAMDGFEFIPWLLPFQSLLIVVMEETIWRGYLISELTITYHFPVLLIVALSALLFGFHHLYFGVVTAGYKAFSAMVWGAIFILSGSIWVAFSAHIISDLLSWRQLLRIARTQSESNQPYSANSK